MHTDGGGLWWLTHLMFLLLIIIGNHNVYIIVIYGMTKVIILTNGIDYNSEEVPLQ